MAWKNAKNLTDDLVEAARTFDDRVTAEQCEKLVERARRDDQPFPLEEARRALDVLRKWRRFPLMERLADAFIQGGQAHATIRRLYAQALLDQGRLSSAVSVLERIVAESRSGPENAEARGLLGRAYKQMYVDGHGESRARGRRILETAIRCYHGVFEKAPARYTWHGVNAAALLRRAERDGIRLRHLPKSEDLAEQVLGIARRAEARFPVPRKGSEGAPGAESSRSAAEEQVAQERRWNAATALEASIGIGNRDEAHVWLERYLGGKGHTAFQVASTHRQLVEVWQLVPTSGLGADVLPVMEGKLLQLTGAGLAVKPGEVAQRAERLERVLGNVTYVDIHWYRRGLERCALVARVEAEGNPDRGFGTGFLVRGSDLGGPLGGKEYLVTNAHVVSAQGVRNALRPGEARVSFKANPALGDRPIGVRGVVKESPPDRLDFAVLELDAPVGDERTSWYPLAQGRAPLDDRARAYVIGHPGGGGLSLSLSDNALLDYDDQILRYRTPTEPGSSGSPVFNDKWELLGLHHAGGTDLAMLNGKPGRQASNEGIWIEAIRNAIRA